MSLTALEDLTVTATLAALRGWEAVAAVGLVVGGLVVLDVAQPPALLRDGFEPGR